MSTPADATTFGTEVLERSKTQSVVVDFWAEWCGPCHQLSPLIERVARRYEDEVALVKVDVDGAPELARKYRVQGIPAVKAFKDGAVVSEFTGVKPEQAIEQFFAALAPSASDRLVRRARDADDPEPLLREALEEEADHEPATLALAELLAGRGEVEPALALLDKIPQSRAAAALRSRLNLEGARGADVSDLRERASEGDAHARVELGRALAAQGSHEEALDELLAAVSTPAAREGARQAILEIFDVLGPDHELVARARPRLASALY